MQEYELYQRFLQDVITAIEHSCDNDDCDGVGSDDARNYLWFCHGVGLCSNLEAWETENDTCGVWKKQKTLFSIAGLDDCFPFNANGNYKQESIKSILYKNDERLAWIYYYAYNDEILNEERWLKVLENWREKGE